MGYGVRSVLGHFISISRPWQQSQDTILSWVAPGNRSSLSMYKPQDMNETLSCPFALSLLTKFMDAMDSSIAPLWTCDILCSGVGKGNLFIKASQVSCGFFLGFFYTCVNGIEVWGCYSTLTHFKPQQVGVLSQCQPLNTLNVTVTEAELNDHFLCIEAVYKSCLVCTRCCCNAA